MKDAIYLLESDVHFLGSKVMVTVEDGLLTLEGTVEWDFQKVAAEKAMQCIRGVEAVANLIEVVPAASPANIQKRTEEALCRSAEVDARQIKGDDERSSIGSPGQCAFVVRRRGCRTRRVVDGRRGEGGKPDRR